MAYTGYAPAALGAAVNEFSPTGENSLFNYKERPRRDVWATWAFSGLAALVSLWGIASFVQMDPNAAMLTEDFFYGSPSCDVEAYAATRPAGEPLNQDQSMLNSVSMAISVWLPITAVMGLVCGAVYVLLFRKFAQGMVFATVIASLATAYFFSFVALALGAVPFGVVLLIGAVLLSGFYYYIRSQLRMCARLLSVAGTGLRDNAALVPAAIGIKVVGVAGMGYMFAALLCTFFVGSLRKTDAAFRVGSEADGHCEDVLKNRVACCAWEPAPWTGAYVFFNVVAISWTSMIVLQVKLYTVAGTIAQWYFAPQGAVNRSGSVRLALRYCMTSSFGTVSFAAGALAMIRAMRRSLERAGRENIICCIINCVAQPLLRLLEQFTQFTTIAAAITGEGFLDAARNTFALLKRNFLRTYSVWWVPEMCLNMAVLLFSFTWATVVFFATCLMFSDKEQEERWNIAAAAASVCFMCIWFILYFVASLLLDIVNTVYICYAMDRDAQKVTMPEVHAIYAEVPSLVGPVVEQPGGELVYGAPVAQPPSAAAGSGGYSEQQGLYGGQQYGYSHAPMSELAVTPQPGLYAPPSVVPASPQQAGVHGSLNNV